MNKKAIWLTVGLMGIALVGILTLQFYWINWSVKLNEKQFDDSVIAALKRISDMLQKEKENWEMEQLNQILQRGGKGVPLHRGLFLCCGFLRVVARFRFNG